MPAKRQLPASPSVDTKPKPNHLPASARSVGPGRRPARVSLFSRREEGARDRRGRAMCRLAEMAENGHRVLPRAPAAVVYATIRSRNKKKERHLLLCVRVWGNQTVERTLQDTRSGGVTSLESWLCDTAPKLHAIKNKKMHRRSSLCDFVTACTATPVASCGRADWPRYGTGPSIDIGGPKIRPVDAAGWRNE